LAASRLRTPDGRHSASEKGAGGIQGTGHEVDGVPAKTTRRNHLRRSQAQMTHHVALPTEKAQPQE
jgi:hypothetical protein